MKITNDPQLNYLLLVNAEIKRLKESDDVVDRWKRRFEPNYKFFRYF